MRVSWARALRVARSSLDPDSRSRWKLLKKFRQIKKEQHTSSCCSTPLLLHPLTVPPPSSRWGAGCGGLRGRYRSSKRRTAGDRRVGGSAGGRTNTRSHAHSSASLQCVYVPVASVLPVLPVLPVRRCFPVGLKRKVETKAAGVKFQRWTRPVRC